MWRRSKSEPPFCPRKPKAAGAGDARFASPQTHVRITTETGVIFGNLAASLQRVGRGGEFRINDLWLAAQAVQRDLQLLTANPKDFADVPALKVFSLLPP